MIYCLYKITNKINGRFYIGAHKTTDINDGYMGSSRIFDQAIEKYGKNNFVKEIVETFESEELMYSKEAGVVDSKFILREDTYNIKLGGNGGWSHISNTTRRNNLQKLNDGSPEHIERCKKAARMSPGCPKGENRFGIRKGKDNFQFGLIWITNEKESVKIKKTDLIPEGWRAGRRMPDKPLDKFEEVLKIFVQYGYSGNKILNISSGAFRERVRRAKIKLKL